MKTNETHESVSRIAGRALVLVSLLAVALALAASSFAQTSAAAAPKVTDAKAAQPSANSLTAKAAKAPKGTGEGIQVHGWWTIEIRNRDGSVAKHVEFENALVVDGPAILAGLLSGTMVAGSWELVIYGTSGGGASLSPCSLGPDCVIVQAGTPPENYYATPLPGCAAAAGPVSQGDTQPFCYATLAPSLTGASTEDFGFSSFTLNGQAYADTQTAITEVASDINPCISSTTAPASTSPSACYPSQLNQILFTEYDFYPALSPSASCGNSGQPLCEIPVQAGQVISASVTFSFSSPSGDGQSATPALAHPHPFLRAPASTKPTASTPVTQ
jgi:hypothetical protein